MDRSSDTHILSKEYRDEQKRKELPLAVLVAVVMVVFVVVSLMNAFGGGREGERPDDEMLIMAVAGMGIPYDEDRAVYVPAKRLNGEPELCRGQRVYCVLAPLEGRDVDLDQVIKGWRSSRMRCPIGDDVLIGTVYRNPNTGGWEGLGFGNGAICG